MAKKVPIGPVCYKKGPFHNRVTDAPLEDVLTPDRKHGGSYYKGKKDIFGITEYYWISFKED